MSNDKASGHLKIRPADPSGRLMRVYAFLLMTSVRVVVAMMMLATVAVGQDLVSIAPKNAKVVYEDARIRVVRLQIAANQTLPMQDRPTRVVICLTRNDVVLTAPDGTQRTLHVAAGNMGWSGPGRRSVRNLEAPLENVIVEIKNAHEPARPVTNRASDTEALVESHHRLVVDNQYVRVYDVRIPPGSVTEYHRHAYDTVSVRVSGAVAAEQRKGGEWSMPHTAAPGEAEMVEYAHAPLVHRVRNLGEQEFHVVLVELK